MNNPVYQENLISCNSEFNLITVPDLEFNPALPTVPYFGFEK
jgi:hypothetical protein